MMISTRGRYALRVMIDLAEQQTSRFIPLKEVAERQEISEKYLESIVKNLVQNGYLEGLRGKGGGYRLVKPPEEYTVGAILRLMEGSLAPVSCLEQRAYPCTREPHCRTLPMWKQLYELVNNFFDGITIADLIAPEQIGNYYVI